MNAVFSTEGEASAAIAEFESRSKTRFMVRTVPKGFGTLDYAQTKNHYVVFEDKSCVPKIEFDGIPFMILGRKVLHCHRGRDYHKKPEKSLENNRDFKQRKLRLQNTKRIGCTARIVMRDIIIFPSHKVSTPSEWRRKCASRALRKSITKSEAAGTRRIVVTFPQQSDHHTKCISEPCTGQHFPRCCESGRGRGGNGKRSRVRPTAGTSPQNRRDREGDSGRVRRQREKIAMEEKIASFFEERPFFYNEAHKDYKNKDRRNAELAEFATVIGSDAGTVWKRFASNRTDYRKLKKPKSSESGQGAKKLTNLQKFKLTRYKFLDAHIMPRGYSEEMEEVPSSLASNVGDDDDGEDDNNDDDLARPSAPRQGQQRSIWTESEGSGRSVNTKKQEVVDLLSQMLEDNRQKDAETEKRTEAAAAEKPQHECEMWGSWLSSVARKIPPESWRSFQRDTLKVALRYLPPEGLPALPVMPAPAHPARYFHIQLQSVLPMLSAADAGLQLKPSAQSQWLLQQHVTIPSPGSGLNVATSHAQRSSCSSMIAKPFQAVASRGPDTSSPGVLVHQLLCTPAPHLIPNGRLSRLLKQGLFSPSPSASDTGCSGEYCEGHFRTPTTIL